jgi:hypothetical protein
METKKTGITDWTFGKWNVQTVLEPGKVVEIAEDGKLYATRCRETPKTR